MSSENKKRGRSDLESECGEEPLAKRINNLHLNNHNNQAAGQQYYNGHSSHQQVHHNQNHSNHNFYQQQEPYDPELTENENPHYFQKNKVLYQLHMERERRGRNHQS